MRPILGLTATFILAGCGSTSEVFTDQPPPAGTGGTSIDGGSDGGPGGSGPGGSGVGGSVGGSGGGSDRPDPGPPAQLVSGPAGLTGVTSDGWAVYRDADTLRAVAIAERPVVETISPRPGSVLVRGRVVFNWADVDWLENVGDLSFWTADSGAHDIGMTPYAEALVGASDSGLAIVYPANVQDETMDLMLVSSDLSESRVLIEGMGRGSDMTCGPSLAFVGERLFVGWCEPGSRAGRIDRYEQHGDDWTVTVIARDVLPEWATNATGDGVFYQSSEYRAYYAEEGEAEVLIDTSVGRGFVVPDGSAVLYTVGDQLRRSTLPTVNPIPIVTRGYANPLMFSTSYDVALYSTTVSYEGGTFYDLKLVHTDDFTPEPVELVSEPIASLARSSMTADGRFVFYLTDVTPSGGLLHVIATDGTERLVLPNVVDVLAARGSTLIITDNSSDPTMYPVVADLRMIDVATETEPRLIEAKIAEARTFELDAAREKVVFVRSGVDRNPMAPDRDGLFYGSCH